MLKRPFVLLALLLVASFLLPVSATAQEPGVIRLPIGADPEHLDPFRSTTTITRNIIVNVYEGLVTFDPGSMTVIPALADSWDISEDGLTYTFHLKPGVLFQAFEGVEYESREVTAEDWVWSMQMFLSGDETISAHPEYLEAVVGAPEFTAGEAEEVAGIEVLDDYTLALTLSEPNHRFLYDLINVYVVPQEAYEQLGEAFSNTPVGTGPFIFQEWLRDDHITLVANPNYWEEGYPLVDELRFLNIPEDVNAVLMYREGELDLLTSFPAGQRNLLQAEFADHYVELPGLNVRYFGFKMEQGFFAENPLVRQAFAHAFNRDLVWNTLMEGARFPGDMGVLPPSMPAADVSTVYEYDLERAAELLAEAGFPNGEGMPTIQLYVFASAADELSLPTLQADLASLGVNLEIVVEDNSTYWSHIGEDDVIMFLSGWSADFSDPSEVFNFLFLDARDDTHYNNPAVNELIRQAMTVTDDAERADIYLQAHELIMQDCPWIVSAYSKVAFLQQPWVEGVVPSPAGVYRTPWKYVSIAVG